MSGLAGADDHGWSPSSPLGVPVRAGDPIRWGLAHAAVAYAAGVVLSIVLFNVAGGDSNGGPTSATVQVVATAGLWAGFLGGACVATRWFGRRSLRDDVGLVARPLDVPIGIVVGVVTQLVVVPIVSWPVEQIWHTDVTRPTQQLIDTTTGTIGLLYLAVIVIAPVAEEVFFRGLLLRSLARRYTDRVAIVGSGALFAVSHFKPAQIPGLFAVGVILAALATHHRRLGPAIAAHMAFSTRRPS